MWMLAALPLSEAHSYRERTVTAESCPSAQQNVLGQPRRGQNCLEKLERSERMLEADSAGAKGMWVGAERGIAKQVHKGWMSKGSRFEAVAANTTGQAFDTGVGWRLFVLLSAPCCVAARAVLLALCPSDLGVVPGEMRLLN